MANEKQAKFIIDVSAEKKRVTESSVRFFSYDSKTAEIIIQAEKEEQLISKSIVSNVEIFFESVDASFQPTDKLKWKDQMTVAADGLFSYLLPDNLLNYQGLVAFEIYINYTNNDKSDSSYRIVYAQRSSAIDRAAGEIELVYIKDFEALKKEVADKAAEVKESLAGYDSGLGTYSEDKKDEMDVFSTSVGTLASAEKLKIQAELPKVQQTTASETTKIKAELPKVQAVATAEIGKIKAVLPTVENAATEVSDYADQKIIEYDAKLEESNQKMNDLQQSQTALTTKLTETQQKITDSDVFTKQESSANVAAQIDARNLTNAWSWSADGTDRFTKVYPGENYVLKSKEPYTATCNGASNQYPASINNILFNPDILGKSATIQYKLTISNYVSGDTVNLKMNDAVGTWTTYGGWSGITGDTTRIVQWKGTLPPLKEGGRPEIDFFTNLKADIIIEELRINEGTEYQFYTPAPSEDPINAYPTYKGQRLADSNDPADYDWQYTDEYVDYLIANYNRTLVAQLNDLAGRVSALESN